MIKKMTLIRQIFNETTTIGKLFKETGEFFCWTLEDKVRDNNEKIMNETAIPYGIYELSISLSPRFKREMVEILKVPNFNGVRIHGGNTYKDTNGCILVAKNKINDTTIQGTMEKEVCEYIRNILIQKDSVYLDIIR